MSIFSLGTEATFSAAHFLPDYDGPCRNMHGHTWRVEVEYHFYDVKQLPSDGILVDFAEIKSIIKKNFDHTLLNDHPSLRSTPTAERLADVIVRLMPYVDDLLYDIWVKVWESDVSWVLVGCVFNE